MTQETTKDGRELATSPPIPKNPDVITGLNDLPAIEPKVFKFTRDGNEYSVSYRPLTYDQVEDIRASILPPKPPMRRIPGLEDVKGKAMVQRQALGLPTHEPDEDDPAYKASLVKYNNDVKIEQLRRALGWDVPKEEFLTEIRKKLYPGELQGFMDEVDGTAWSVNSALVDRFFGNFLNPRTSEESDSPKNENV